MCAWVSLSLLFKNTLAKEKERENTQKEKQRTSTKATH
jgi:hypothetical protein